MAAGAFNVCWHEVSPEFSADADSIAASVEIRIRDVFDLWPESVHSVVFSHQNADRPLAGFARSILQSLMATLKNRNLVQKRYFDD